MLAAGTGDATGETVAEEPTGDAVVDAAHPPASATGSTRVVTDAAAGCDADASPSRSRNATTSPPADTMVTTSHPSADIEESRSAREAWSEAGTETVRKFFTTRSVFRYREARLHGSDRPRA